MARGLCRRCCSLLDQRARTCRCACHMSRWLVCLRRPGIALLAGAGVGRSAQTAESPPPTRGALLCSVQAAKGHRPYMEDDHDVARDGRYVAVYDGHGGAGVSRYLHHELFLQTRLALATSDTDRDAAAQQAEGGFLFDRVNDATAIEQALRHAFRLVADNVCECNRWWYQGSTSCVVLVHMPARARASLISANVGDSRAVLSRHGQAVDLTEDHKPNLPSELERIERLGGSVQWHGFYDNFGKPVEGTGVYVSRESASSRESAALPFPLSRASRDSAASPALLSLYLFPSLRFSDFHKMRSVALALIPGIASTVTSQSRDRSATSLSGHASPMRSRFARCRSILRATSSS